MHTITCRRFKNENLADIVNQESFSCSFYGRKISYLLHGFFFRSTFDQLGFKRAAQQETVFYRLITSLGLLALEVGREVIPKMDVELLFYFTYAPQGDQAALDTAKEWTNDPLWEKLESRRSSPCRPLYEVSDKHGISSGGVLSNNIMLIMDRTKILTRK